MDEQVHQALNVLAELAARESGSEMAAIRFFDRTFGTGMYGVESTLLEASGIAASSDKIEIHDRLLSTVDAQHEHRFFEDPYVAGPPHARFYARQPLLSADGSVIGTLCVFGRAARAASSAQLLALDSIARAIVALTTPRSRDSRTQLSLACASCVGLCTSGIAVFAGNDADVDLIHPMYVNDALCEVTGFSRDELLAGALLRLVGENPNSHRFSTIHMRLRYEPLLIEVVPLYRKDGTKFMGEVRGERDRDANGNVVHNLIIRDISIFHNAQQRLHLLSRAVDEAADFFVLATIDPAGSHVEYVNQSLCDYLGWSKHEIEKSSLMKLLSPDNDPEFLQAIRSKITNREPISHELRMQRADGSSFWAEIVAHVVADEDSVDHWLAVGRDITVRRQAHEQMAELVESLDYVRESVALYLLDKDSAPVMVYENQASFDHSNYPFLQMLSVSSEDAKRWRTALQRGHAGRRWIAEVARDAATQWFEFEARGIAEASGVSTRILTHLRRVSAAISDDRLFDLAVELHNGFGAHLETWSEAIPDLCQGDRCLHVRLPGDESAFAVISWNRLLGRDEIARIRTVAEKYKLQTR